ncbi:MAG TPA: hypothetical protein PLK90_03405 [Clostridiales bacterium]|nr:hypothetical protein [Clostridiales bacterium]HQP69427.1 hypothetical protein [Clostridiales bacterium]
MVKKFMVLLAVMAALLVTSCSDDKSSDPSTNSSQDFQNDITGVVGDVTSAQGASAMAQTSGMMDYLPFAMPIKSINETFAKLEKVNKVSQMSMFKKLFPASDKDPKQEDHLIFVDHVGTYTLASVTYYTDPDTGESYVTAATWNSTPGVPADKIIIDIPKSVSGLDNDVKYILNGYTDMYVYWTDSEGYSYYDWYPTHVDFDLLVDNVNVFALDMTASGWAYRGAMDDVMAETIDYNMVMTPFTMVMTLNMNGTLGLDFTMNLKENAITQLNVTLSVLFLDPAWDDISSIDLTYTSNNYTIELYADSDFTTYMDSETATPQGTVDFINAGTDVYVKIFEGDNQIGQLKAKVVQVTDPETGEVYDSVAFYIEFTDGSQMTMEQLAALFSEYAEYIG